MQSLNLGPRAGAQTGVAILKGDAVLDQDRFVEDLDSGIAIRRSHGIEDGTRAEVETGEPVVIRRAVLDRGAAIYGNSVPAIVLEFARGDARTSHPAAVHHRCFRSRECSRRSHRRRRRRLRPLRLRPSWRSFHYARSSRALPAVRCTPSSEPAAPVTGKPLQIDGDVARVD